MDKTTKFQECRELFEAALWSDTFTQFIQNAIEDIDFYEGRQWDESAIKVLESAGLKPVTVNLIGQKLDALAGREALTRTRFVYKSRSVQAEEVQRASDISNLALWIQERNRTSRILSQAKHMARICGLGWHCYHVKDGAILERDENPLHVVWDTRDDTPMMTNQGFVARVRWMTREEAKQMFPNKADELDSAAASSSVSMFDAGAMSFLSTKSNSSSSYKLFSNGGYFNEKDQEVAIVEFHYRVPVKYYTYATIDGLYNTFDKQEAEQAARKAARNDNLSQEVQEVDGYKVMLCYFCGDVDLKHEESPYQIDPAKGLFSLTPVVFARGYRTNVPYGLVGKAKDSQRLYNTKQAKINWLMAARQVVMDKGAVEDIEEVRDEINRPDAVIEKVQGKEFKIEKHEAQIAQHYQALALHARDIEKAMGIYDEMLGVETNAQSGVAIARRQNASASTQLYFSDGFAEAQRNIALKLLCYIQTVLTDYVMIEVTDDDEIGKRLEFNKEVDGKRERDVRLGNFDVVVEQVPDSDTMDDVAKMRLIDMIQGGFTPDKWTVGILDLFDVPKNAPIRKEIEKGLQQKLAQLDQLQKAQGIGERPQGQTPLPSGGVSALQTQNTGSAV